MQKFSRTTAVIAIVALAGALGACAEQPRSAPGTVFVYSDINFIVLGELVRIASGRPLHVYAAQEVFAPLKMSDSGFLPPKETLIVFFAPLNAKATNGSSISPTKSVSGRFCAILYQRSATRLTSCIR